MITGSSTFEADDPLSLHTNWRRLLPVFSGRGRPVAPNYRGGGGGFARGGFDFRAGMDYNSQTRPMLSEAESCKE